MQSDKPVTSSIGHEFKEVSISSTGTTTLVNLDDVNEIHSEIISNLEWEFIPETHGSTIRKSFSPNLIDRINLDFESTIPLILNLFMASKYTTITGLPSNLASVMTNYLKAYHIFSSLSSYHASSKHINETILDLSKKFRVEDKNKLEIFLKNLPFPQTVDRILKICSDLDRELGKYPTQNKIISVYQDYELSQVRGISIKASLKGDAQKSLELSDHLVQLVAMNDRDLLKHIIIDINPT